MILRQVALIVAVLVIHSSFVFLVTGVSTPETPFQLNVTPALVNRYTAKNMTLRCDHNPGVQTEISQVFRIRILKKSTSGWSLVAEQRDNENSPRVTGNLTASATVNSGVSGAFLQVSWLDVGEDNFGVYICEDLAFDISNRLASVPSLELDIHEFEFPTEYFESLSKETHDTVIALKKTTDSEIPSLKKDIIGVHELVDTIHQNQSSILSQIDKFETNQSSLKSSVKELETRVSSMQSSLTICETKLNSLTQWPEGFYALLQPKTGCPVDLAFFRWHSQVSYNTHRISIKFRPSQYFQLICVLTSNLIHR